VYISWEKLVMAVGLEAVKKTLNKSAGANIDAFEWHDSVVLTGKVKSWEKKIRAGFLCTGKGYKGVVNDIEVDGIESDLPHIPSIKDSRVEGKSFDIAVIGGGIIGASIARELSRYSIKTALLEKEADLARHASGHNDGMIHPGIAPSPGSKKAEHCVRGNRAFTDLCRELGIGFKRPGSIILFKRPFYKLMVPVLNRRAAKNSVDGYRYITGKHVKELEPWVTPSQHGGFFLPSAGVLSPYKLTIACAENACENDVEIFLNTAVLGFETKANRITKIKTNRGDLSAKVVVNAAGVWADMIADFAGDRFFSIHPRKGMDIILDINTAKYQTRILAMPSLLQLRSKTKGGGIIPTIEGNLLIGPTAEEVPYREDFSTDPKSMDSLLEQLKLNTKLNKSDIITFFSGTRACTYEEDFILEASEYVDNLVHAAGIQSPGLTASPSIADKICKICVEKLKKEIEVKLKPNFLPVRNTHPELSRLSYEERSKIMKKNPSYGRIVCRCETISEGEIRDAMHKRIQVYSLDGIKMRTRAGMGRCQGGFCSPRVMEIISEESGLKMTEIKKEGENSEILPYETKNK
jgi:glycerol-3-phosphate dehydrogenase